MEIRNSAPCINLYIIPRVRKQGGDVGEPEPRTRTENAMMLTCSCSLHHWNSTPYSTEQRLLVPNEIGTVPWFSVVSTVPECKLQKPSMRHNLFSSSFANDTLLAMYTLVFPEQEKRIPGVV